MHTALILVGSLACLAGGLFLGEYGRGPMGWAPKLVFGGLATFCLGTAVYGFGRAGGVW